MSADQKYDGSWDEGKQKAWDQKYEEWEKRDWPEWLNAHLSFPFQVVRNDDDDDAYFTNVADHQPFRLGHTMTVLALVGEEDMYGIIIKVREGRKIGYVPLCDTEVVSRDDKNFWPVREYAAWFANR